MVSVLGLGEVWVGGVALPTFQNPEKWNLKLKFMHLVHGSSLKIVHRFCANSKR